MIHSKGLRHWPPLMLAVVGDDPKNCHEGRRAYFPHVEFCDQGGEEARSFTCHGTICVNEGGNNRGGEDLQAFDALALLLAASSELFMALVAAYRHMKSCGAHRSYLDSQERVLAKALGCTVEEAVAFIEREVL